MLSGMPSKTVSVLGAARLSKAADESTSIERQNSGINGWAKLRSTTTGDNYEVVHISEDSDVSRAVNPFDRAGLGPYLREPLLSTWTVLNAGTALTGTTVTSSCAATTSSYTPQSSLTGTCG